METVPTMNILFLFDLCFHFKSISSVFFKEMYDFLVIINL